MAGRCNDLSSSSVVVEAFNKLLTLTWTFDDDDDGRTTATYDYDAAAAAADIGFLLFRQSFGASRIHHSNPLSLYKSALQCRIDDKQ